ncbi:MAG: hypothetical protein LBG29_09260 [Synergistaceae bacterium]|jgi:membrane protein implicated in regulation of membrane protease activity|nr:hypothetical protein [Synergistaceae bacterium]
MFARLVTGMARLVAGVVRLVVTLLLLILMLILMAVVTAQRDVLGWRLATGLIVFLMLFFILYMATAMFLRDRRLKRQQDIDILKTDVNKIDDEAAWLAKKYKKK